jgi:hypothetical protein
MLADERVAPIQRRGRLVVRSSVDFFHRPRAQRYQRGRHSPAGYFLDSFVYDSLKAYRPYHFCAWLGVTAEVVGRQGRSAPSLGLHVWGGDVDRWLDAAQAEPVFLSSAPRDGHDYYFVPLFAKRADESVEPVSAVYPLTTFANGKDGRCARNQIALVFRPAR